MCLVCFISEKEIKLRFKLGVFVRIGDKEGMYVKMIQQLRLQIVHNQRNCYCLNNNLSNKYLALKNKILEENQNKQKKKIENFLKNIKLIT